MTASAPNGFHVDCLVHRRASASQAKTGRSEVGSTISDRDNWWRAVELWMAECHWEKVLCKIFHALFYYTYTLKHTIDTTSSKDNVTIVIVKCPLLS